MQFKILERKEMIRKMKTSILPLYDHSSYNIIRVSKLRYKKILQNALSIISFFELELIEENGIIGFKVMYLNSIDK